MDLVALNKFLLGLVICLDQLVNSLRLDLFCHVVFEKVFHYSQQLLSHLFITQMNILNKIDLYFLIQNQQLHVQVPRVLIMIFQLSKQILKLQINLIQSPHLRHFLLEIILDLRVVTFSSFGFRIVKKSVKRKNLLKRTLHVNYNGLH